MGELAASTSIVFMIEFTSECPYHPSNPACLLVLTDLCAGLDARAAAIVMRTVRNIVNTGRTIVCTIHQPSIDIFEAFDELLLLKRGGELIFNGQLGHKSKHLVRYYSVSFMRPFQVAAV